jgi:hypothetical protein
LKIDTLKFAKELTEAGMTQAQAEAIVRGVAEADTSDLATKADIAAVKSDLKAEIARLEARIDTAIAELKAEMFRFLYLQAAGIVGLTVALIKLLP